MSVVTLSSEYEVLIPQVVRERLGLQPGQKFQLIVLDDRIKLIPFESAKALRGFMKGANPELQRAKVDRSE